LARRLKAELTERGITARLLRDTDTNLSLNERAEISNEQHSSVYLSLHAGTPGDGVRIYVPALASPPPLDSGRFLPWESAQSVFLGRSEALASALSVELIHRRLDVATLSLPLRPLNNVAACAIAVEMATGNDPHELASPKLQNAVAGGIATVVAQMRTQLEGQP
jgi:N-acetylmuramoyl-L-alanine amidase